MKLVPFPPMCEGIHRSGWPHVMTEVRGFETGEGPLLDDFVDASFGYRHVKEPHIEPWVGIFHHPAKVDSPIANDKIMECRRYLYRDAMFRHSVKHLRGAVVLAPSLVPIIEQWLRVPVLLIKHPSQTDVTQWKRECLVEGETVDSAKRLFQVGFFMRDTRFIYSIPECGVDRYRSKPYMSWQIWRDKRLKQHSPRAYADSKVAELDRLSDADYDEMLSTSVVATRLFAAAANNVVVECAARSTPLLVNRLPEVEWYLGKDYPLYFDDRKHAGRLLSDESAVQAAHEHLRDMDKSWLCAKTFARRVYEFTTEVCA